jgi:hypothetical protein
MYIISKWIDLLFVVDSRFLPCRCNTYMYIISTKTPISVFVVVANLALMPAIRTAIAHKELAYRSALNLIAVCLNKCM